MWNLTTDEGEDARPARRSEVLFIGGRSGVGKSTGAAEVFAQLAAAGVKHCLIEGDNLDMAHPIAWEHGLAEANLAAMWRNYRALGYSRLIYTNTACVREDVTRFLVAALGDEPLMRAVLLTSSDTEADRRLALRELGSGWESHSTRSRAVARELEAVTPPWVVRIDTNGRPVTDIARQIVDMLGWVTQ